MRRRYPGNKSYSLGNLCAVFDMELEDPHRALCDARAAADAANLINRKRDVMGPVTRDEKVFAA
jgi:DNA polymerase-3 subunit epsilon